MTVLLIAIAVLLFIVLALCLALLALLMEIGERIDLLFSEIIEEEAQWYLFNESEEP